MPVSDVSYTDILIAHEFDVFLLRVHFLKSVVTDKGVDTLAGTFCSGGS